jgi:hypothetical protein
MDWPNLRGFVFGPAKANIVSSDFACDFCTIVDRDRRSEFCESDPPCEKQLVGFGSTEKKNA